MRAPFPDPPPPRCGMQMLNANPDAVRSKAARQVRTKSSSVTLPQALFAGEKHRCADVQTCVRPGSSSSANGVCLELFPLAHVRLVCVNCVFGSCAGVVLICIFFIRVTPCGLWIMSVVVLHFPCAFLLLSPPPPLAAGPQEVCYCTIRGQRVNGELHSGACEPAASREAGGGTSLTNRPMQPRGLWERGGGAGGSDSGQQT